MAFGLTRPKLFVIPAEAGIQNSRTVIAVELR